MADGYCAANIHTLAGYVQRIITCTKVPDGYGMGIATSISYFFSINQLSGDIS